MTLSERDQKIIWHPLTQEKTASPPIAIEKGSGSYVYDETGKAYLDLISSWWVNLHGHAEPEITRAIYDQANTLEHIIFAGFTHEPAVQLCEGLRDLLPESLSRFFFSDNGSSSVEIALKMAYQYWLNQNETDRTLFLSFDGGYHGDTFGAMAVGAKSGFHDAFNKLLFKVLSIPFAATWEEDKALEKKENQALEILDTLLAENGDKVAAMILEPLIQASSGMRLCRPEFVRSVITRVRQYGILVIFDEVMTGFGRTGSHFALDQVDISPDLLCLSKGITGGFLPLALTITTKEIYNAFLGDSWKQAFLHSHSYAANPLACAAAIASLKLLKKETTQNAIKAIHQAHQEGITYLKKRCTNIKHTRTLGTMAAFEVTSEDNGHLNHALKKRFLEEGLLLRPIGNTVYLLPPYSTTASQLALAYQKIVDVLKEF